MKFGTKVRHAPKTFTVDNENFLSRELDFTHCKHLPRPSISSSIYPIIYPQMLALTTNREVRRGVYHNTCITHYSLKNFTLEICEFARNPRIQSTNLTNWQLRSQAWDQSFFSVNVFIAFEKICLSHLDTFEFPFLLALLNLLNWSVLVGFGRMFVLRQFPGKHVILLRNDTLLPYSRIRK